jgi:cephalosporin hydroxylase
MQPAMEKNLDMQLRDILPIMQRRVMEDTTYFGIPTLQSPTDFWIYQEIIFAMKPDFIVEIGNYCGGSALAFAHLLDQLGHGTIIGIDIDSSRIHPTARAHPRIRFMEGDACSLFEQVRDLIGPDARTLIIEDSSHTKENTLNILRRYSELTKPGDYLIIEDSICYHGLDIGPNPGPYEAIEEFISENKEFEIDRSKEGFMITWNPIGYLKRRQV